MPKDYGRWIEEFKLPPTVGSVVDHVESPPDLMRPLSELEADYANRVRNLYPSDPRIPRGPAWDIEIERIMRLPALPKEYADSPVWRNAFYLFDQIRALRGEPGCYIWYPV